MQTKLIITEFVYIKLWHATLIYLGPIRFAQHTKIFFSYLFIGESIQILMIVAEEKISQNGVSIAHSYVLILQCGLDDGVHQDLKRSGDRTVSKPFHTRVNSGRQ